MKRLLVVLLIVAAALPHQAMAQNWWPDPYKSYGWQNPDTNSQAILVLYHNEPDEAPNLIAATWPVIYGQRLSPYGFVVLDYAEDPCTLRYNDGCAIFAMIHYHGENPRIKDADAFAILAANDGTIYEVIYAGDMSDYKRIRGWLERVIRRERITAPPGGFVPVNA